MQINSEDSNIYEDKRKESLIKLTQCQESKSFNSCSQCDIFFDCLIRKEYVDNVFKSMNKGQEGGFEF